MPYQEKRCDLATHVDAGVLMKAKPLKSSLHHPNAPHHTAHILAPVVAAAYNTCNMMLKSPIKKQALLIYFSTKAMWNLKAGSPPDQKHVGLST